MKRASWHFLLLAVIVGLPASHWVLSAPQEPVEPEKVVVCHVQGKEQGPDGPVDRTTGILIEVSANASEHHLAHHRDCVGKEINTKGLEAGECSCRACGKKGCADDCLTKCDTAFDKCSTDCGQDAACYVNCKETFEKCRAACK